MEKQILEALNTRYATKKFDPTRVISEELLATILESVRLTPTSYGLQLMKLIVVENADKRNALLPYSYGQRQVVDASHLLILCREKMAQPSHVNGYINTISSTRNIPSENLDGFKNMMLDTIKNMSEEASSTWMDKQTYIALGNLLNTCALLEVDACPMEGFQAQEYNRELGLDNLNLSAVLTIPIGYRSEDDANAKVKKVRRSTEDFVVRIK